MCAPAVGHPWDLTVRVKCGHFLIFGFIFGIANLALNIFLLALPVPVILTMHLSVNKKIGLLAIFMVGSL